MMTRTLLMLFLLCSTAPSAVAASLYVGETTLEDRSRVSAAEQLQALDEVLARLTGRFDTSLVAETGLGAADLDRLILSQQLINRQVMDEDGQRDQVLRLQVEFDAPAVNALLHARGLPRWGRERPAVLLWMAIEDEEGSRLLDAAQLEFAVIETARTIGLDILRPLGDALDMSEVTLEDVRGGFLGAAEEAAQRYGAGVIAMLDLRAQRPAGSEPGWNARWRWRVEGQDGGRNHSGDHPRELIEAGLKQLASQLAARWAVSAGAGESRQLRIRVDGIVDEVQYAEVLRHLEGLSMIESLQVLGAEGRHVDFELISAGDRIETYLQLGGLLRLERRTPDGQLHFRLSY